MQVAKRGGSSQRFLRRLARGLSSSLVSSCTLCSRQSAIRSTASCTTLGLPVASNTIQRRCFAAKVPKSVDIILREQIDELGYKGQHLQVSPGYARNYLVPEQLAVYASPANLKNYKVTLSVSSLKTLRNRLIYQ
eukprot:gb/GECG01005917.1/.p1 GENE.gb/GECG01005917.1/~~gb/GECG01005917.1/.p1  ORF type:complete len:135 (+),score=7.35 gb/GECG01005917.1/:1-405(+)